MMKLLILISFLLTLLVFLLKSPNSEQRKWTDVKGRTMQAEFVRLDSASGDVIFRKDTEKVYRFPLNQLCRDDRDYIEKLLKTRSLDPSEPVEEGTNFEKSLTTHLIRNVSGQIQQLREADLRDKDYYAIYYSAHWCPPCQKFTPVLVSFYNSYSRKYDNFEIIFVSSDRNEKAMEDYMRETNMPWPALRFDQNKQRHPAVNYSGKGIPSLVLIDDNGNILADSYVGNKYVGPGVVMDKLKEILSQN